MVGLGWSTQFLFLQSFSAEGKAGDRQGRDRPSESAQFVKKSAHQEQVKALSSVSHFVMNPPNVLVLR